MSMIKRYEIKPDMINIISGRIDRILDVGFFDDKYWVWVIEHDNYPEITIQVIGWKEETQIPTVEDYDFFNELFWICIGRTDDIFWFAEEPMLKQIEAYEKD